MSTTDELDKAFISPYDKFLYQFDREHALSLSQQKEKEKHARIAKLRDYDCPKEKDEIL